MDVEVVREQIEHGTHQAKLVLGSLCALPPSVRLVWMPGIISCFSHSASGRYTDGARHAAERANAKVVLIDGDELAELMIDHGVGVSDFKAYTIRRIDTDYFEPE